jgi:hypothetical protein
LHKGKTRLAVAIAYRAIQNGFNALFLTAAQLIDELSLASRQGELSKLLPRYTHPDLLVVDEVGYLSYGTDAANMLFHLVNERHLRGRSLIFTTNKHPTQWGGVLHDEDLAAAIVDRILERGRLYHLDGPSMRTRHLALDKPVPSALRPEPDRISGIHRTEFPEPTALSVLLFLICHGLCHPLPPKITALRVDLKIRGALYFALHEPEVHVGQRLHAREVLGDLPHLQSVHFSALPAVGETGETALERAPRRPPRRERSVLAAREDLSRHLGRDDPHRKALSGLPLVLDLFRARQQPGR